MTDKTNDHHSTPAPPTTTPCVRLRRRHFVLGGLAALGASVVGVHGCMGSPRYRGQRSDHFDGEKFFNPQLNIDKVSGEFWKWRTERTPAVWPKWVDNPPLTPRPAARDTQAVVTMINHATLLIETPCGNFLTDPIWSTRASPVQFAGPKRVHAPGIAFEKLPRIDYVLISHDHYDHLDLPTCRRLTAQHDPLFLCGLGVRAVLGSAAGRCIELDWWQPHVLSRQLRATFAPTQHWSGRWTNDRRNTLWGAFVVDVAGGRFYFGGDTGYSEHFRETATRFPGIDLSLLPIGAYAPRWFMKNAHMDPAEAVRGHLELGSKLSVGMHWGTFQLTDEPRAEPIELLASARAAAGVSASAFVAPLPGEWVTATLSERGGA